MKTIEVVAGIIMVQEEILCMQRGTAKYDYISCKYEFPGGKIEKGEKATVALQRELQEEMDIEVDIAEQDFFMTVEHEYPDFRIIMHSYLRRMKNKKFTLKEHIAFKWLKASELKQLDWAGADIPIVEKLIEDAINE